jgi:peptidoglycan/LPS O-acetylase OafA/YrhL
MSVVGERVPRGRLTLARCFDAHANALDILRLALAATVAVVHATEVGFGHQPELGASTLGDLAVDGFFVLSGFLVTESLLRLRSLRRYAWHRFLRIMPGFWVCLVITAAVVAPLGAHLGGQPVSTIMDEPDTAVGYVTSNAALQMRQFGISGVTDPLTGEQAVLDGALWTLFYEAGCYVAVALLGVAGALRGRTWLVAAACAGLWLATMVSAGGVDLGSHLALRFLTVFMFGVAARVYADRVPVSGALALLSLLAVGAGLAFTGDYRAVAAPAFAYMLLWAAVRLPFRHRPRWDLSYGVYVYHWPIQLLLALAGATVMGEALFVLVSLALACAAAAASWLLVERRALRLKGARWVESGWRRDVRART